MKKILTALLVFSFFNSFSQNSSSDYFYVRTKDSMPFLKYGNGEDRLGGAKMGFLDSNIILKVVDSFKKAYKVQLSELHAAYIDKKNVITTDAVKDVQHLTGSWKVYGDSLYDYLTVELNERLPYKSMQEINPSRIVIDIFGAPSNTNWITQLRSAKEIKNAWYEQQENDVMRVIIELKHKQHWGIPYLLFGKQANSEG